MSRVIVAGGGAAGMMAAVAAGQKGHQVILFEKNEKLGKKLFITGKGRCNVTNACDMESLFQGVVTNSKFLYSSFYQFTNKDMMDLLERHGCPLKTERGNRVFPVSDKSSDVINALNRALKELSVEVHLNSRIKELIIRDGRCAGVCLDQIERKRTGKAERGQEREIFGDLVIVATGGMSYPSTGSTGDGYLWAKAAGHKITDLSPALAPLEILEEDGKSLQGLSLKNIRISLRSGNRECYQEFGEMLFTHFGVSGPVILSASSFLAKELKKRQVVLSIDLKPALSLEQLDSRIVRDFQEGKNRQFKNSLSHLLPNKLIPVMIGRSGIHPDKQVNEITRIERRRLAETLKDLTFTVTGIRDYKEAIITQGGVSVKEINPSTMESKKVKGLCFAGEILDLDGVTGGYNLQIAWSTGWAAGSKEAELLR
ncbi:MAG: NAD(P)/FAD-dependent oxidoreductase [Lachnospiraceae bacterium]|jgi:predicted Rossmann fold flavoprotein|nr:NAD(P)/FAD-dependent oxidoreductase [Lachnospiraceae bacterium]